MTIKTDIENFKLLKKAGEKNRKDLFSLFLFSRAVNIQFIGGENVNFTCDTDILNELRIKAIGVDIRRSENILIQKLGITNMIYDGVYLGYNSKSVTIDDVSCLQNTRQGMSVTSAADLTIKNSEFNGTNALKSIDYD